MTEKSICYQQQNHHIFIRHCHIHQLSKSFVKESVTRTGNALFSEGTIVSKWNYWLNFQKCPLQGALTERHPHQKDQNSFKCANNRKSEFYLRQFAMYWYWTWKSDHFKLNRAPSLPHRLLDHIWSLFSQVDNCW